MSEKRCLGCKLTKPIGEFYKAAKGQRFPDGYRSQCKTCTNRTARARRAREKVTSTLRCPVCGNHLTVSPVLRDPAA